MAHGILVPRTRTEPVPSAVEAQNSSHWEIPCVIFGDTCQTRLEIFCISLESCVGSVNFNSQEILIPGKLVCQKN